MSLETLAMADQLPDVEGYKANNSGTAYSCWGVALKQASKTKKKKKESKGFTNQ
jgi:hypothetical protein